ncbi:MAG: copper chaperone PCu(A)C [Sphingomonas sp.]|uniref:copper chaperone PCu(A)C n=1 Tax=Sphingomonas sp. TaxID=28214 RepID=UPI0035643B20
MFNLARRLVPVVAVSVAIAAPLLAHQFTVGKLLIGHPWSRATSPRATTAGGYLSITNSGDQPDKLIGATSPYAKTVILHSMTMDGGIMRMRPVKGGLVIPAKGKVALDPDGYHLMFTGLKGQFVEGAMVPATLRFERAGSVTVQFKVEAPGATMKMEGM